MSTTFILKARLVEMKDGTHEFLNKDSDVKLRSLPHYNWNNKVSYAWHLVWRDGKTENTLYSSRGRDCFRKKDLSIKVEDK